MRILLFSFVLFGAVITAGPSQARDQTVFERWLFNFGEEESFDPHIHHSKVPHRIQWQNGLYHDQFWHPQNWVNAVGSVDRVMDRFYNDEFIRKVDMDCEPPYISVGDSFMRLSSYDKRRVMKFFDYANGVTGPQNPNALEIYYFRTERFWGKGDPVAYYGPGGLQLR